MKKRSKPRSLIKIDFYQTKVWKTDQTSLQIVFLMLSSLRSFKLKYKSIFRYHVDQWNWREHDSTKVYLLENILQKNISERRWIRPKSNWTLSSEMPWSKKSSQKTFWRISNHFPPSFHWNKFHFDSWAGFWAFFTLCEISSFTFFLIDHYWFHSIGP